MSRNAQGRLDVSLRVTETATEGIERDDHIGKTVHTHRFDVYQELIDSPTGELGVSRPWSKTISLTEDSEYTLKLTGDLDSLVSGSLTMTRIIGVAARHNGTVSGTRLNVSADWMNLSSSIGPGGVMLWLDPRDGVNVISGSHSGGHGQGHGGQGEHFDEIFLNATGGSFTCDIMILGRDD